jgi:chromatin segregation and condensation protein Rec8/ScpA/Scc1 (kleisin family)
MIKSKIDARERALELAVELAKAQLAADYADVDITEITRQFLAFLIGDAELPEVTDVNAHPTLHSLKTP